MLSLSIIGNIKNSFNTQSDSNQPIKNKEEIDINLDFDEKKEELENVERMAPQSEKVFKKEDVQIDLKDLPFL